MKSAPAAMASLFQKSGGEVEIPVSGRSMEPTLKDGTLLRVRCGAFPAVGQIIVYGDEDQFVAHRVEALIRTRDILYFIARGDHHWLYDRPIPQDRVMGVVTTIRCGNTWVDPPVFRPTRNFASATELILLKALLRLSALPARWYASLLIFGQVIALRLTRFLTRKR